MNQEVFQYISIPITIKLVGIHDKIQIFCGSINTKRNQFLQKCAKKNKDNYELILLRHWWAGGNKMCTGAINFLNIKLFLKDLNKK